MQSWKLGAVLTPAISGLVFGIQQIAQSNYGNNNESSSVVPPQQIISESLYSPEAQPEDLLKKSESLREEQRNNQNSVLSKLDDYTFKLLTPCSAGTGWILDYQIPQQGHYPTVWYIATAAHVVNRWKFDNKNNTYKQKLPKSCLSNRKDKVFDLSISKHYDTDNISKQQIKTPKLFWTALDLFKKESKFDIKEDNFKDFAVIEITFETEDAAREMTKNFAEKYAVGSSDGINIFSDPLDPTKTKNNKSRFYSLGYPDKKTETLFLKKIIEVEEVQKEMYYQVILKTGIVFLHKIR